MVVMYLCLCFRRGIVILCLVGVICRGLVPFVLMLRCVLCVVHCCFGPI